VKALAALEDGAPSNAFNLGTGHPHSVKGVIEAVERVSGKKIPWTLGPRRAGDPAALFANPARVTSTLGWRPVVSDLESIVRTAWHWHETHPHGYRAHTPQ
jgi:UDP-glucose 4-epimerase